MAIGSLPTAYGAVTKWDRPEMQETRVRSLGWEDPLEEGMATHSSVLAWSIPWQRSLVGCSPRGHTESDMTEAPEHGPGPGGHISAGGHLPSRGWSGRHFGFRQKSFSSRVLP